MRLLLALLAMTVAPIVVSYRLDVKDDFLQNLLAEAAGVSGGILLALVLVDRVTEYRSRVIRREVRTLISGRFEMATREGLAQIIASVSEALGRIGVADERLQNLGKPYALRLAQPEAQVVLELLSEVEIERNAPNLGSLRSNLRVVVVRFERQWHEIADDLYPLLVASSDEPVISAASEVETSLAAVISALDERTEPKDDHELLGLLFRNALVAVWNLALALGALVDSFHGEEDYFHD